MVGRLPIDSQEFIDARYENYRWSITALLWSLLFVWVSCLVRTRHRLHVEVGLCLLGACMHLRRVQVDSIWDSIIEPAPLMTFLRLPKEQHPRVYGGAAGWWWGTEVGDIYSLRSMRHILDAGPHKLPISNPGCDLLSVCQVGMHI